MKDILCMQTSGTDILEKLCTPFIIAATAKAMDISATRMRWNPNQLYSFRAPNLKIFGPEG